MNATWVQDKIDLYDGELVVFKRANSPIGIFVYMFKKKESIIRNQQKHRINTKQ